MLTRLRPAWHPAVAKPWRSAVRRAVGRCGRIRRAVGGPFRL